MSESKNTVYLLLGGNLQDVAQTFLSAISKIKSTIGPVLLSSSLYESEPWGFESSNVFLNQVILVKSQLEPIQLLNRIQNIELELGRTRTVNADGFESRIIDIDILYFNSEIIQLPNLDIPHYALHERRFTLAPLAEIAPNFIHPIFNKKNLTLLNECNDSSIVTKK
jgi:2-amino-4-hydroxy-6-hydroxymethyldihydropteridine diphosphokinase